MKIQKLLITPLMALTLLTASGCNVDTGEKLTVWTFTNELNNIGKQYKKKFGKNVNVKVWGDVNEVVSQFLNALDAGSGIPDVLALESAVVKDLDIQPYLTNLNDINGVDQMYEYTKSVASDKNGNTSGMPLPASNAFKN